MSAPNQRPRSQDNGTLSHRSNEHEKTRPPGRPVSRVVPPVLTEWSQRSAARSARRDGTPVSAALSRTCLAGRTLAVEGAHAVVAGGAGEAAALGAVVLVLAAVVADPAVDADARVAAHRVGAGGAVLADGRPQRALVHVLRAARGRSGRRLTQHTVTCRLTPHSDIQLRNTSRV